MNLDKLHQQTAQIPWQELQRFYAQGKVRLLSQDEDLVKTAAAIVENDEDRIGALITSKKLSNPDDKQARMWVSEKAVFWAVVVTPWVLIQAINQH